MFLSIPSIILRNLWEKAWSVYCGTKPYQQTCTNCNSMDSCGARASTAWPISIQAIKNRPGAYQLQMSRGRIHKAIVKDWLLFKDFGPSIVIKNQGPFSLKVQVFSRIRNFTNSSLLESLLELKFYLVRIKSQTGHLHLMPSQSENVEFYIFLRIL